MKIQSVPITRVPAMLRRAALLLLAFGLSLGILPAHGQTCDRFGCGRLDCATPARPAPSSLSGFLEAMGPSPLPTNRDATAFDEFKQAYGSFNWFESLDVENGYLIAGIAHGIQVWDLHNNPANPELLGQARNNVWPVWINDPHTFWPLHDVDAPANVDTMAAIVGQAGTGVAIFDLSDKPKPRLAYQGHGLNATQVYAATLGGAHYAFVASYAGPGWGGGGLKIFNMDAAVQSASPCSGDSPAACPGVYVGKLSSRSDVHYIDGVDNFLVLSSGTIPGFEIWNVANPASPIKVMSGFDDARVYGVALWKQSSSYYLGLIGDQFVPGVGTSYDLRIYDVSCITGTCGGLGPQVNVTAEVSGGSSELLLMFSHSGSKPFLYATKNDACNDGFPQREFLFDVSDPVHPTDVGSAEYWDWYYRGSPTGFNKVAPLGGKFYNDYFYRAGHTIMDVHKLVGGSPPGADFDWNPKEIYPGTPVNFTDLSTGAPTIWQWSFPNGTPSSSTVKHPQGVTFAAGPGNAAYDVEVTLNATNTTGTTGVPHTLTIQSPNPQVASLTATPAQALRCAPIALTANGAKGQPPLVFNWSDPNDAPLSGLAGSTTTNTTTWQTTNMPAGTYTVKVKVASQANGSLPPASATAQVVLDPLPQMPVGGTFTPTNDVFTAGTVKFHLLGTGATEVSWKFGDEQPGAPDIWTTDFNPIHTYTETGQKTITAKIRQCGDEASERPSAPLTITITQISPLVARFAAQGCFSQGCPGTVGVPVIFTDSSSGSPDFWDYSWDGDDTYEDANHTAPVLSHTYSIEGTFKPKLRLRRGAEVEVFVHGSDTQPNGVPIIISAGGGGGGGGGNPPSIAVSGPGTGQVGVSYTYTATAANCTPNPSGWIWGTSGGAGSSTTSSISITWSSTGGKSVTATNSGCAGATGSRSVAISSGGGGGGGDALLAAFTFSPPAPGVNQSVAFDASASTGNPVGYAWVFGDGSEGSGKTVNHTFAAGGSYPVKLTISKPGTTCSFGICTSEITRTVVVSGGPPAPNAEFNANVDCVSQICQTNVGVPVTLTAVAEGAASYVWDFGDGTGGSGREVTHSWNAPGNRTVKLTVGNGQTTASKTRVFVIEGEPISSKKSEVLPWIAQTRGLLVQSSDLYVHNPGTPAKDTAATPMKVTLEFRKKGAPESNPPQAKIDIAPGATFYKADVLKELFDKENIAGFISLTVDEGVAPVITSFNTTFQTDGKEFGQAVAGVAMVSGTSALEDKMQHLVGLINNDERLAYFGLSNPSDQPTVYKLRFFDKTGNQVGADSPDFIISRFGQKQFQAKEVSDFGLSNVDDFRVEIETKSGGHLVPYASNLRLASEDPSFILAGAARAAKVYLIGVLSTKGLNNSLWQTDALLSNPSGQPIVMDITFTSVGLNGTATSPLHLTLNPGQTERLENVIDGQWGIKNGIGVLTIATTSGGAFPIVQGESYDNTNPAKRFGQSMMAVSDASAAGPGQGQYLVGLRQDAENRTTFWVFNPGSETAEYDVIYRRLDGTPLGDPVNVRLGAGKLRQFSPGQHPLPAGGVADGFTVQILVKSGKVLGAAQVINNLTNDPAYIQGEVR